MKKPPQSIKFRDYLNEQLSNKKYAKKFLQIALEDYLSDGDRHEFFAAIKAVADASGGITNLAKKSGLSRQALYKIFSEKGNPEFSTVVNILDKVGYKISLSLK